VYNDQNGYSTLTIDGDALVISGGSGDGSLDVVHTSDGSVIWHYRPDQAPQGTSPLLNPIIAVHNHMLYVRSQSTPNMQENTIKAFDVASGKLLWTSAVSPLIFDMVFVNNTPYVIRGLNTDPASSGSEITQLNPQNGQMLNDWEIAPDDELIPGGGGFNAGILYTSGPTDQASQICAIRVTDGSHLWCQAQQSPFPGVLTPPAFTQNTFYSYQSSVGGNLVNPLQIMALNTSTGATRWQQTLPGNHLYNAINTVYTVALNGIVYVTTGQGVFALRGSDGQLLWHTPAHTDLESDAHPSVTEEGSL